MKKNQKQKIRRLLEVLEPPKQKKVSLASLARNFTAKAVFGKRLAGILDRVRSVKDHVKDLEGTVKDKEQTTDRRIKAIAKDIGSLEKKTDDVLKTINEKEEAIRKDLLTRTQSGGGNANRQIKVNGVDVLTKYTDINLVGSITTAVDNTDKNIDITFASGGNVDSVNGQTGVVVLDTGDIADTVDKRYVTDADLVVIGNTSGTNTGDQTSIVGITGTKAQFDTAVTDGNFLYVGDVTQYTDEMAQDAVGNAVGNGLDYDDTTGAISVDETELTHNSLGSKQGGTAGEFYHLTSAQNTLVGALDADLATFSLPASTTISTFGASLVDDAAASNARTTLGLGTAAVVNTDLSDLNEATIETAIDTLANLTSIQGRTVTLADAGANAIFGWDDTAGAYENLTAAEVRSAAGLVAGGAGDIWVEKAGDTMTGRLVLFGTYTSGDQALFAGGTVTNAQGVVLSPSINQGTAGFAVIDSQAVVNPTANLTAAPQYGMLFLPTIGGTSSFDITNVWAMYSRVDTQAAYAGDITTVINFVAAGVGHSGSGTITNVYGYYSGINVASGRYGLYLEGTADNYINGNVGIGTTTFGTSAAKVLALANGTVPSTSPADMIQIFSTDLSAGNATLGLRTETGVVTESVTSDRTLSVKINGTTYKICLKA